ncbi:hypothetical protein CSX04_04832 [Burkholderia cepacia]|nr:hypothetical protein CSX04_04832 [Burkholderia cepacia]
MIEDLHAIVRAVRGECAQDAGQVLHADRRHARDRDVAALAQAGFANFGERVGQLVQQPARLRQETPADFGEGGAARGALDERDAEKGFELAQPLCDGRLRDVQRIGRLPEAAAVGDSNESLDTERIDFHQNFESITILNSFY